MDGSTRTLRFEQLAGDDLRGKEAYYYADGSQVPLHRAEELAVDLPTADRASLPKDVLNRLSKHGRELRKGIVLLDGSQVPSDVADALDAVGALPPVFRSSDGSLVVVLPEVRVEAADKEQAERVRRYLHSSEVESEMVRDSGERLVLRPASGRGADALDLANRIVEKIHPLMAQARFLRVVPRPGPDGRG
jgi:hypothetical protein